MKKIFFILPLVVLLASCGIHKKGTISANKADKGRDELISAFKKSDTTFRWMTAHGKIHYSGNGQDFTASSSLRFRSDSVIWANATYLIEVVRALIKTDSATVLNRANREYYKFSVGDLQQMLAIPGLTLQALQRIFMAYPPFGIDKRFGFTKRETDYKLEYTSPTYMEQIILDATTFRMKEYVFKVNESKKIKIAYEDFDKVNGLFLPKKINFELETPEKTQIVFDISEYTLSDSEEVPFSIPASYRKR